MPTASDRRGRARGQPPPLHARPPPWAIRPPRPSPGARPWKPPGRAGPDIVFLDLMLPDINGFDVCEALKSSRPTSAIPVVMVTARMADENRLQGFRAGATDYVPKPYTPDQIFGAMAQADAWREATERRGAPRGDRSRSTPAATSPTSARSPGSGASCSPGPRWPRTSPTRSTWPSSRSSHRAVAWGRGAEWVRAWSRPCSIAGRPTGSSSP